MQNRHPADRLADVRFEIKRLEVEEAKLRAYLLEHPHDRVGEEHIAVIGSQSRKRVNLKGGRGWCFPVATFHHLQVSHGCAAATAGDAPGLTDAPKQMTRGRLRAEAQCRPRASGRCSSGSFDMNSSARLQCYFSRSSNGATGVMTPCCKPKYRSSMSEDTPSFDLML